MSWHTLSEELDVWFPFEASIPVRIYQQIDQAVFVGDNKSLYIEIFRDDTSLLPLDPCFSILTLFTPGVQHVVARMV